VLVYLHGFNSSPASFKARLLARALEERGCGERLCVPQLPPDPAAAIALAEAQIAARRATALVGSSLGGYYATYLAEKHGLKAVLINPAVRPYELLAACLGEQRNLYTGEVYAFTRAHLEALRALEVERLDPERYLLLVATGDEVLDYRAALEKYEGCARVVVEGGDHSFGRFSDYLEIVLDFCGIAPSVANRRVLR
jgi:predicted esterase YcpF (UPF0227 family)